MAPGKRLRRKRTPGMMPGMRRSMSTAGVTGRMARGRMLLPVGCGRGVLGFGGWRACPSLRCKETASQRNHQESAHSQGLGATASSSAQLPWLAYFYLFRCGHCVPSPYSTLSGNLLEIANNESKNPNCQSQCQLWDGTGRSRCRLDKHACARSSSAAQAILAFVPIEEACAKL